MGSKMFLAEAYKVSGFKWIEAASFHFRHGPTYANRFASVLKIDAVEDQSYNFITDSNVHLLRTVGSSYRRYFLRKASTAEIDRVLYIKRRMKRSLL